MGNTQSNRKHESPNNWEYYSNNNGIDLYRRSDGLILQKRKVTLDQRYDLTSEYRIYKMRETNQHGYVKVYQVIGVQQQKNQTHLCECSPSSNLIVYSERIQNRLSDLPQLPFSESLNILYSAATSFHRLFEEFGPFHINGELIGINLQGKVRVWFNQNWAINHPSHQITYHRTMIESDIPIDLRNQNQMITNLLQIVEEKTERGKFPQPFLQEVYENSGSWRKLKKYLSQIIQCQKEPIQKQINYSRQTKSYQIREDNPQRQAARNGSKQQRRINEQVANHVQQTQSIHIHQHQRSPPIFGQKIKGSVILPAGYVPQEKKIVKPTVSFVNKNLQPQEVYLQHQPLPMMQHRTVNDNRYPLHETPQYSSTNGSHSYPRFMFVNGGASPTNPPVQSINHNPHPSSIQFRDHQLEQIRKKLRQDISYMSSHHAQYRVEGENSSS